MGQRGDCLAFYSFEKPHRDWRARAAWITLTELAVRRGRGEEMEGVSTNVSRIWRNVLILNMWKISRGSSNSSNNKRQPRKWQLNNEDKDEDASRYRQVRQRRQQDAQFCHWVPVPYACFGPSACPCPGPVLCLPLSALHIAQACQTTATAAVGLLLLLSNYCLCVCLPRSLSLSLTLSVCLSLSLALCESVCRCLLELLFMKHQNVSQCH